MSIFNSLGSNYDFKFVINSIFAQDKNLYSSSLKSFLEKKYGGKTLLVYKGREALTLALNILNLPKGSFVAINGFTCYAVYKAIIQAGYSAECLDIENYDLNFSEKTLINALNRNPQIKVVVVQNTLGYPCDIEKIEEICERHKLILIEDLAHSVGTKYSGGREAGTAGDFVTLSFSQDKIIDAVSGGALVIRNKNYQKTLASDLVGHVRETCEVGFKQQLKDHLYPSLTYKIRFLYNFGLGKPLHFLLKTFDLLSKPMSGYYGNYSLPNWYCSLTLLAFKKLAENLEHRKQIANIYKNNLDKKVVWDSVAKNIEYSSNLRFPIFLENRKKLIDYLKKYKIYVYDIWYDSVSPDCEIAQTVSHKILNLPTHINVSQKDALYICNKINKWVSLNLKG